VAGLVMLTVLGGTSAGPAYAASATAVGSEVRANEQYVFSVGVVETKKNLFRKKKKNIFILERSKKLKKTFSKMSDKHREPTLSREEMKAYRIPIEYRDYCAHLLIPLNICRQKNYYLPTRCQHERHAHEICEYDEYNKRAFKKITEGME